jgi:hypothetical protein
MEFGCSICEYTSLKKENVTRHINKQNSCGPGLKEIVEMPIDITCEFCNKIFASITTLKHHQKDNCKLKLRILEEENKKLKQQLIKKNTPILNDKEDPNYIYLIKIYPYEDNIYIK